MTWSNRYKSLAEIVCGYCAKRFAVPAHKANSTKFCDRKCWRDHIAAGQENHTCAMCGIGFKRKKSHRNKSKSGFMFCSRSCKTSAQRIGGIKEIQPGHYGAGESDYRGRALNILGPECKECGYDNQVKMLDVHHLDGDRSNNKISNLQVLCIWCHAAETRGSSKEERDILRSSRGNNSMAECLSYTEKVAGSSPASRTACQIRQNI